MTCGVGYFTNTLFSLSHKSWSSGVKGRLVSLVAGALSDTSVMTSVCGRLNQHGITAIIEPVHA